MAKIKLTKTELKHQQDALKQYRRFLPTLQLKKQQLQLEIRSSAELLRNNLEQQDALYADLRNWIALFGSDAGKTAKQVKLKEVRRSYANIAGVNVPVFEEAVFEETVLDTFQSDWYCDDAVQALQKAVSLKEAHEILEEQYRLLNEELRSTTQRVNLFEKVKIPECQENIRAIGIQIGDMEVAAVARSKIAKRKTQEAASL